MRAGETALTSRFQLRAAGELGAVQHRSEAPRWRALVLRRWSVPVLLHYSVPYGV